MNKITIFLVISSMLLPYNSVNAYTQNEKASADFLAFNDIIVSQEQGEKYELDAQITRKEMAKVTLKLSGKSVSNRCSEKFDDLKRWDWGCKYAEAGVKYNFFTLNTLFNPQNNISKIEALKMVMKWTGIKKSESEDWRKWYVTAGLQYGLLEHSFEDYDSPATRWWIFTMAQHAIEQWNNEVIELVEELLNI